MWYCITSIYRAGGNVTRDIHTVHSPVKPADTEREFPNHVVVDKYFDTEDEALEYLKGVERLG